LAEYRRIDAKYSVVEQWARTPDSPVISINWYQAVSYCNWLSKQEGMPESEWCYEPLQDPKTISVMAGSSIGLLCGSLGTLAATCGLHPERIHNEYKEGMRLAKNYLKRKGYRLPTEAEMEYATRAGAVTSRYYGETDELLEEYAWYSKNGEDHTWPVGGKKPNDLGLFDMQGNAFTWCQERYRADAPVRFGGISDDKEDETLVIRNTDLRVLRGGSCLSRAFTVRSAYRFSDGPAGRGDDFGLRLARTLLP
jgi:hypothetical protein